jgi:peptide/nickel transport system ATP-binding protein
MNLRDRLRVDEPGAENLLAEADTSDERSEVDAVMDEFFSGSLDGDNREVVRTAIEQYLSEKEKRATETLRERFESICERKNPKLQEANHITACHLYS